MMSTIYSLFLDGCNDDCAQNNGRMERSRPTRVVIDIFCCEHYSRLRIAHLTGEMVDRNFGRNGGMISPISESHEKGGVELLRPFDFSSYSTLVQYEQGLERLFYRGVIIPRNSKWGGLGKRSWTVPLFRKRSREGLFGASVLASPSINNRYGSSIAFWRGFTLESIRLVVPPESSHRHQTLRQARECVYCTQSIHIQKIIILYL